MLNRLLRAFDFSDLVAEAGGGFVGFVFDGAGEVFAEFGEFGLAEFDGVFFFSFTPMVTVFPVWWLPPCWARSMTPLSWLRKRS